MGFAAINALRIVRVADKGVLPNERVILRARMPCNLTNYLILDNTFAEDGSLSELNRHVYWFPHCPVTPDDWIVLYTKNGSDRSNQRADGDRNFFFYWGLDHTVWNKDADMVTIIHTSRLLTQEV